MNKYNVYVEATLQVLAESEEEAIDKALEGIDGTVQNFSVDYQGTVSSYKEEVRPSVVTIKEAWIK